VEKVEEAEKEAEMEATMAVAVEIKVAGLEEVLEEQEVSRVEVVETVIVDTRIQKLSEHHAQPDLKTKAM